MCRYGWQRHIVNEATQVLDALKAVRAAGGGGGAAGKPAKGGATGAALPVSVEVPWLIELTLNVAFGLEDAGKDADAQKKADEASLLLDEFLKEQGSTADPAAIERNSRLRQLVWNARAYFSRKAPGKVKDDIVKAGGSGVMATALFVCNGGISGDAAAEELIKAWSSIDDYDLRGARDAFSRNSVSGKAGKDGGVVRGVKPQALQDLAMAVRAACCAKQWPLALCMVARLEKFQMPPGRGRIYLDLAKAECEVWQACNVKKEDPVSKMLLSAPEQEKREIETRHRSVKLVEQCIMIARRIEAFDLVEECAVVMWNISRELMSEQNRYRVHKPLQKCAELLEEMQSNRLVPLRVQLHFEVAHCEVASDLLTKGAGEYQKADTLDYTAIDPELPDKVRQTLSEDALRDPAPFLRRFDEVTEDHLNLLHWKTNLYEEPSDVADEVMLVLDQVAKVKGAKNDKGEVLPLSEEKKRLNYNLLVQAFEKLEVELEALIGNDRLQTLKDTFEPPPPHITGPDPLKALPFQAPATVFSSAEIDGKAIVDKRPVSEKEETILKAKRIVRLMCHCGLEAKRTEEGIFAVKVCSKAMQTAEEMTFGPAPTEVETALLLTAAAYTKAQCLSWDIEDQGLLQLGLENICCFSSCCSQSEAVGS